MKQTTTLCCIKALYSARYFCQKTGGLASPVILIYFSGLRYCVSTISSLGVEGHLHAALDVDDSSQKNYHIRAALQVLAAEAE